MANENAATGGEFLTFTLGPEEYGIDILKVQEIRGYDSVTTIANTPNFIKGVINLRGIIVPIVDMRIKFKLENVTYDQLTRGDHSQPRQSRGGHGRRWRLGCDCAHSRADQDCTTVWRDARHQYLMGLGTVDDRMPDTGGYREADEQQ